MTAVLLALLGPEIPGALCTGQAPLHDDIVDGETPTQRRDRHTEAARVCRRCPALDVCQRAALEPRTLAPRGISGILAGVVVPESPDTRRTLLRRRAQMEPSS